MEVDAVRDHWVSGEAQQAGALIYDATPNADRPAWAASILELACSQAPSVPSEVQAVINIARDTERWREAHAAFMAVRRLTLAHEKSRLDGVIDGLLLFVAENAAKVIYNASGEPASFDYDCGCWLVGCLRQLVDAIGSHEFEGRAWSVLWPRRVDRSAARRYTQMVEVRPEQPGDAAAIHAVHARSFPTDAEARLVDLLRAARHLIVSLVAEADGVVVGHIAFSPVSGATGAVGGGLAPVAVLESHRRQGIAAKLIEAGLGACRSAGFDWVVVLGEPAYYARFGFQPAAAFGLSDQYGGGPAFQVVELVPGGLPAGAGLVRYAPEFASLG